MAKKLMEESNENTPVEPEGDTSVTINEVKKKPVRRTMTPELLEKLKVAREKANEVKKKMKAEGDVARIAHLEKRLAKLKPPSKEPELNNKEKELKEKDEKLPTVEEEEEEQPQKIKKKKPKKKPVVIYDQSSSSSSDDDSQVVYVKRKSKNKYKRAPAPQPAPIQQQPPPPPVTKVIQNPNPFYGYHLNRMINQY